MVIKRYVVRDMPEAVVLIRKELGKDAVILSTKKIRMRKWLGLWRQNRIEVLAAVGEDVPVRSFDSPFVRSGSAGSSNPPRGQEKSSTREQGVVESLTANPSVMNAEVPSTKPQTAEAPKTEDNHAHQLARESVEWQQIREEIADLRRTLETSMRPTKVQSQYPSSIQKLIKQGIAEEVLWDLVKHEDNSEDQGNSDRITSDESATSEAVLRSRLLQRLNLSSSVEPLSPSSRIVMFVGPTGVGKTTTIAKIAALQVLSGQRKVGLITTDTFRIAAVEQLRTYANILNVPFEVVAKPEGMVDALTRLQDCDLVFIDTAGRNFDHREHVEHLSKLMAVADVDEVYLVLSLTSKEEDLNRIVQRFQSVRIDKFLFTKLDETHSYGAIFNLLFTYRKPLSYFTTGQNVPNDLEISSVDKLLQLVFSEVAV